jgi:hypothetical protein
MVGHSLTGFEILGVRMSRIATRETGRVDANSPASVVRLIAFLSGT